MATNSTAAARATIVVLLSSASAVTVLQSQCCSNSAAIDIDTTQSINDQIISQLYHCKSFAFDWWLHLNG